MTLSTDLLDRGVYSGIFTYAETINSILQAHYSTEVYISASGKHSQYLQYFIKVAQLLTSVHILADEFEILTTIKRKERKASWAFRKVLSRLLHFSVCL